MGIQMLIPMGKENAVMISTFAGAIVDLILNAIFIPFLDSSGAAIGTLVAELVVLIVQMVYLKKDVKYLYSNQSYFKIIIALAIINSCSISCKAFYIRSVYKLVVSAVLFFGVYVVMLYIMKEEVVSREFE